MTASRRESRARQTLQDFYEQLDRKWREAEDLLLSLEVPAPVYARIRTAEPEFPGAPRYRHELAFLRHYGRWGLCYGVCAEHDPCDQYWTSIHRCSIEQRVEATQAFPQIRDQMLKAAERYTDRVAQALSLLTASLSLEPSSASESHPADPHECSLAAEAAEPVEIESADLLRDEESPPEAESQPPEQQPEAAAAPALSEPPDEVPAAAETEPEPAPRLVFSHSLLLLPAPELPATQPEPCEAPPEIDAPADHRDAEPEIIAPFSIQRWEADGGEVSREAA